VIELNKIICADNLAMLRDMPTKSVDLCLTDPPYNVGLDYANTDDDKLNYSTWCNDWFMECLRISRSVCISCGIVNMGMWAKMRNPTWIICWYKPAAMGRCIFGFNNWEPILFWGKPKKQNGCDVIRAPIIPDKSIEGHPCPKPLEWGKQLVQLLSNESDLILDPFCGSGTTCVAAKLLGRNFIGIDISPEYVKIAEARLRNTEENLFKNSP
jgi:DNA modification methylase